MTENIARKKIREFIKEQPVISTHEHHRQDSFHLQLTLDKIFKNSYVNWCKEAFGDTYESRQAFLSHIRYNSYYMWLEKSIKRLYGFNEPISADNWNEISQKISTRHKDPEHHLRILKQDCRYRVMVQDAHWDPGNNMGHPELMKPTYRVNMFIYGYHPNACDHGNHNPLNNYSVSFSRIDDYVEWMGEIISQEISKGAVALKSALAYDRSLDFSDPNKEEAARAFGKHPQELQPGEEKLFGDYIFNRICEYAAQYDLPFQIHVGLGKLSGSNPINFEPTIARHPKTRFILFHGGYPWYHEVGALAHNYSNVYPDLCWLPLISTTAACSALHEYLEITTSIKKIGWGGDNWTSEESYGALLAFEYVLEQVLSQRVSQGLLNIDQALQIVKHLLFENASNIYGIGRE